MGAETFEGRALSRAAAWSLFCGLSLFLGILTAALLEVAWPTFMGDAVAALGVGAKPVSHLTSEDFGPQMRPLLVVVLIAWVIMTAILRRELGLSNTAWLIAAAALATPSLVLI